MKLLFTSLLLLVLTTTLFSQVDKAIVNDLIVKKADTSGWVINGMSTLNFSQVGLQNWTGGGNNTIAVQGLFTTTANYLSKNTFWDNSLLLGYGLTKIGQDPFRKSDDRIMLISKYGINATEEFRYTGLADFRTQFTKGRNYTAPIDSNTGDFPKTSNLLAPAFLTTAIGFEYTPSKSLSVLLAPLSGRFTFVNDPDLSNAGAFGVVPGESLLADIGAFCNILYTDEVVKNVNITSRLNLFSRYNSFSTMIVTWENMITMKVNSFLNVSLATDVFYDQRIPITREDGTVGPATQLRNIFSLGIGYAFTNVEKK